MKFRWLLVALILPLISCELSFLEEGKDTFNVRLAMNYSTDVEFDEISYTLLNLETGEEKSGGLNFNNETGFASGDVDLSEGYWNGYVTVSKSYDAATGTSFDISSDTMTQYISEHTEEIWFNDPISDNVSTVYISADVTSAYFNYPLDKAGAWLYSTDGRNTYFFELTDLQTDYSTYAEFTGEFNSVKEGEYVLKVAARNYSHPEWTDWDHSRTIVTPFIPRTYYSYSDYSEYLTLKGWNYLDMYSFGGYGYDYYYGDDIFYPHYENGDVYFDGSSFVQMYSYGSDPVSLSVDTLPVGNNRILDFILNYPATYDMGQPIMTLHFKEGYKDMDNRVQVDFYDTQIIFRSFVDGTETTYETYPYNMTVAADNRFGLFMKDNKMGLYHLDTFEMNPDFTATLDPSLPDDLFLHFETNQGNYINLNSLLILNDFDIPAYLNAP